MKKFFMTLLTMLLVGVIASFVFGFGLEGLTRVLMVVSILGLFVALGTSLGGVGNINGVNANLSGELQRYGERKGSTDAIYVNKRPPIALVSVLVFVGSYLVQWLINSM